MTDIPQGAIKITDPNFTGVCAVAVRDDEGRFLSIDLSPIVARDIVIALLIRIDAINVNDVECEEMRGARH